MNYKGTIIEESLNDKSCLADLKIISTKTEQVKESHKTPWLKQWTLHVVEIDENKAEFIANQLSYFLEKEHAWYADFKNEQFHYIIFRGKIFNVHRNISSEYDNVKRYGVGLGIPEYQLVFSPDIQ